MAFRLTTDEFIERAKMVHGDRYDYSKISYLYEDDKITIFCNKHQIEFRQNVHKHLAGQGCRKCFSEANGNRCRSSVQEFIKKARTVHGSSYSYASIEYKNTNTNVKINCPIHGDFYQTPGNHTHKTHPQGCPECAGRTNWTEQKFINKANWIHKGKYKYEKVNFIDTIHKVTIICPLHGEFNQSPSKHLSGQKCPKCVHNYKGNTEGFIIKARVIHGDKYNYGTVQYITSHRKVTIKCPDHGDFEQTPANHTHKSNPQGCPKCSSRYPLNAMEFISRANEKHDFYYDYSKLVFDRCTSKVKIICPYHGEFEQRASVHLNGSGCQKCRLPKGEQKIQKVLTDLKLQFKQQYSFADCKSKHPLPFDFYIRIDEKVFLIEFNGEQHYNAVNFGGDNLSTLSKLLEKVKLRDEIKQNYTVSNGIPLLIIRYDEIHMISDMIKEFLPLEKLRVE